MNSEPNTINEYIEKSVTEFDKEISISRIKKQTIAILKELFLKPYITSEDLCSKFELEKDDLKASYSLIRSSASAKALFEISPYHFLVQVLEHLSKNPERTLKILCDEPPFPFSETMEIFISQKCNADCKFCYRNGQVYTEKDILTSRQYIDVINEFADLQGQNIDISGGLEPLLSPSIIEVVDAAVNRNLVVNLYTNGIALSNQDVLKHLLKINKIRISLNACDRESYKKIMGVDQFNTVIENINNLVMAKKESGSKVKIGISYVVTKENYRQIFEVVKLAQQLKVDLLGLRSLEVVEMGPFDAGQQAELQSVLNEVRLNNSLRRYGNLNVSVADTFNEIINPGFDYAEYINRNFVNSLSYFRITVTPQGFIYALNLVGQPARGDARFLMGKVGDGESMEDMMTNKKNVPFDQKLLLAHDITLMIALSKLHYDLKFGIGLEDNPFIWKS